MRVVKWGNDLAIRLPAAMVKAIGLVEGDEIKIHVAKSGHSLAGRSELLERLRAFRGRLPADFKFDRDEVNSRLRFR